MRNAITIPFSQDETLVITCDNSGAIGMKENDLVKVSYQTVSYFSFRVAVMECMAAGAEPVSVIVQNFCDEKDWKDIVSGIRKGLSELEMEHVQITGSTESNFYLSQSAIGINVIGRKIKNSAINPDHVNDFEIALIGLPLVGYEVVNQADKIVPLTVFHQINNIGDVIVWPVGSKGILRELEKINPNLEIDLNKVEIDLMKSGGPSTSFLALYPSEKSEEVKQMAGSFFQQLPKVSR